MKTTVEITDAIYQKIKARSSLRGQTLKSFFLEAVREKLERETEAVSEEPGWMRVFGKASPDSAAEVQSVIDEEFSRISDEDWK
jgi:hypothetical protein